MSTTSSLTESLNVIDIPKIKTMNRTDYAMQKVLLYNASAGDLPFVNCEKCKNKGYIMKLNEDLFETLTECECMKQRIAIENMIESGLGDTIKRCTFSTYQTSEKWQEDIKNTALAYLKDESKAWFYIGGQSGGGKTHICTAISGNLIKKGKSLKYVIWRNLFHELQGLQFNDVKYQAKIKDLQNVDVLYIDDFLKSLDKTKIGVEMNFAFEIINARYLANKSTIISSELSVSGLSQLDTAIAGRIIEKSRGYTLEILKDMRKNYRLRG